MKEVSRWLVTVVFLAPVTGVVILNLGSDVESITNCSIKLAEPAYLAKSTRDRCGRGHLKKQQL